MPSMCSAEGETALCNTRNWIDNTEAALDLPLFHFPQYGNKTQQRNLLR